MHLMTPQQETERWVMQLTLGIWELAEGVLLMLILSWGVPKVLNYRARDLLRQPFDTPYLGSFFAEYLRVLAQVLMWGLLLFIPGFIRYCQLIFVPLIAMFSKSYREGQSDALRLSEKLVKGRLLIIVGIMIVTMGLQVAAEFAPQMITELHVFPLRVFFAAVAFLISVWTYSLIFLLFDDYLNAEEP